MKAMHFVSRRHFFEENCKFKTKKLQILILLSEKKYKSNTWSREKSLKLAILSAESVEKQYNLQRRVIFSRITVIKIM